MLKTSAQATAGTAADGLQVSRSNPSYADKLVGLDHTSSTAESRHDPITGAWTIFAPHRGQRPDEFQTPTQQAAAIKVDCPFCGGAESRTPPAVWIGKLADSGADGPSRLEPSHLVYCNERVAQLPVDDWTVRVVPNRFPAITQVGLTNHQQTAGTAKREPDLFPRQIISGGHEVIIETPRHVSSITELDLAEVSLLFAAYRDRIAHWYNVPGIAYISVFKNVGGQAGASLKHSHSQLIASNIIPTQLRSIANRMTKYRAKTGCCLQCDLIRAELKEASRVIAKTDSLIAYCPFASPMPMLARITSLDHVEQFDQLTEETLAAVSRMVSRAVSWLEKIYPGVSYNMLVHTRPPGIENGRDAFHWSIDIFPRLTRLAGFEFSTDCKINPMMPELAAQRYRDCAAAEDPRLVLG